MSAPVRTRVRPTIAVSESERLVKLRLIEMIDDDLRRRFSTVQEMGERLGVEERRISKLRARDLDKFSLSWLLRFAEAAQVKIRIDIY
jgi:predicted XRE-type DNA-binding protein